MGGMIAMKTAVMHPERVQSLLMCGMAYWKKAVRYYSSSGDRPRIPARRHRGAGKGPENVRCHHRRRKRSMDWFYLVPMAKIVSHARTPRHLDRGFGGCRSATGISTNFFQRASLCSCVVTPS